MHRPSNLLNGLVVVGSSVEFRYLIETTLNRNMLRRSISDLDGWRFWIFFGHEVGLSGGGSVDGYSIVGFHHLRLRKWNWLLILRSRVVYRARRFHLPWRHGLDILVLVSDPVIRINVNDPTNSLKVHTVSLKYHSRLLIQVRNALTPLLSLRLIPTTGARTSVTVSITPFCTVQSAATVSAPQLSVSPTVSWPFVN